jgi:hypothetical protein
MANTKSTKKRYTDDEKKAYFAAQRERQQEMLAQAVDALTSSEGWMRYLRTTTAFHSYSFNNRILIALQMPEATKVMGAGGKDGKTGWKSLGRRVKAEDFKTNSIKILAPVLVPRKDSDGKVMTDDEGKALKQCVGFKTVEVYDISQTEGEDLATVQYEPITGESHEEYIYRAEALWDSMGYAVEYDADLDPLKGGHVDLAAKKVVINGARALNGQVRTHIHELAHAIGGIDYAKYTRKQAEVIVESAAYIATGLVGLDTAGMSVPYIATWGAEAEDPKMALKIMKEFADTIDTLVNAIVEGIS